MRIFRYQAQFDHELRKLNPAMADELCFLQDVLPGSGYIVKEKSQVLAFGYLTKNPNDRFVTLCFYIHLDAPLCVEGTVALFQRLIQTFLKIQKQFQEELVLRLWVKEQETFYQEFLEDFGFQKKDEMIQMERELTLEDVPFSDTLVHKMDLTDPKKMEQYLISNQEGFGVADSPYSMLFRMAHIGARVYGIQGEQQELIACVTTWFNHPDKAATEDIFCKKAYRKKGYTTRVLKTLFSMLYQEGSRKVFLNCYQNNQNAIVFYQHLGYRKVGSLYEYHYYG